jgi:hypothetical protein
VIFSMTAESLWYAAAGGANSVNGPLLSLLQQQGSIHSIGTGRGTGRTGPALPWPGSAVTSTAPRCCTGPLDPADAAPWLTGDTITVVPDRAWVSFMWSYPNLIPLDEAAIRYISRRVERFRFDRVYGGWWGRVVVEDGPGANRRSAERHNARLHGERPTRGA